LAGKTEVFGENLPQRHFVHHKSHMTRPGLEPRAAGVDAVNNSDSIASNDWTTIIRSQLIEKDMERSPLA
jgi:hypothetical protein